MMIFVRRETQTPRRYRDPLHDREQERWMIVEIQKGIAAHAPLTPDI
jgi:predicted RNA-binding protein with PUA-like domain